MCKCRKSQIVSRCPSWRTQALKAIILQQWLPSAHSPLVWLPVIEPRTVVGRTNQHHYQNDINFRRRWRFFGNDSTDPWTRGLCDLRSRKSKNLEIKEIKNLLFPKFNNKFSKTSNPHLQTFIKLSMEIYLLQLKWRRTMIYKHV